MRDRDHQPLKNYPKSPDVIDDGASNISQCTYNRTTSTSIPDPQFSGSPDPRSLAEMPKSATDATRFTSTTPHAHTKAPPNAPFNSLPRRTPGSVSPPGESLQAKVRRLRAQADKQRDAQVPKFDKVIMHGRVWADRFHRVVTMSLIGATRMIHLPSLIGGIYEREDAD